MSAVAFCMDLILASLLLAALLVGVRLEKRLKVLRESQAGFAGAVAELNAAVARAEHGLAELKTAALEAQTTVADRIQDAKGMTARLERQALAANEAADRLEKTMERHAAMPVREYPPARPAPAPVARERPPSAHPRESGDPGVLGLRARVQGGPAQAQSPLRREALSRPEPEKDLGSRFRGDERSNMSTLRRPAADDELFDIIEPALRAARGMGR
jgi:hypothetical protein